MATEVDTDTASAVVGTAAAVGGEQPTLAQLITYCSKGTATSVRELLSMVPEGRKAPL